MQRGRDRLKVVIEQVGVDVQSHRMMTPTTPSRSPRRTTSFDLRPSPPTAAEGDRHRCRCSPGGHGMPAAPAKIPSGMARTSSRTRPTRHGRGGTRGGRVWSVVVWWMGRRWQHPAAVQAGTGTRDW